MNRLLSTRCTCPGGDADTCAFCERCERIEARLKADAGAIRRLNGDLTPAAYDELDALSAAAYLSGDWTAYGAAAARAFDAALAARVAEEALREIEDEDACLAVLVRAGYLLERAA